MSFANKTDYVGLESIEGLQLRSNGQNKSNTVVQIPGSDGSILGDEQTVVVSNPTCEYAITKDTTVDITLGDCYNEVYALSKVHISTSAGGEPVLTADAVQVESDDGTICKYDIPGIEISPKRHASNFGSCTYTESKTLALQSGELDIVADISPATINGEPVASDATAGMMVVDLTFWTNSDTTPPAVTSTTGWSITSPWNCTGADSSMFSWTVQLTRYLVKDTHS